MQDAKFNKNNKPNHRGNRREPSKIRGSKLNFNYEIGAENITTIKSYCRYPVWINEGDSRHPHPISAASRKVYEEQIHQQIMAEHAENVGGEDVQILDIGGSVRRNSNRPNVWSAVYPQPGRTYGRDIARILGFVDEGFVADGIDITLNSDDGAVPDFCIHKGCDCSCIVPDVNLYIHSLYYVSCDEMIDTLEKSNLQVAYSLQHDFDVVRGSGEFYNGEAVYVIENDEVIMDVSGNDTAYVHPVPFNNGGGVCYARHSTKPIAVVWSRYELYGCSVYKFHLLSEKLTANLPQEVTVENTLARAINDFSYVGSVPFDVGDNARPNWIQEEVQIKDLEIWSDFRMLIVSDKQGYTVKLPKGLIQEVAICAVGRDRDDKLYMDLIGETRRQVKTSKWKMKPKDRLSAVTYVPILAAYATLSVEISLKVTYAKENEKSLMLWNMLKQTATWFKWPRWAWLLMFRYNPRNLATALFSKMFKTIGWSFTAGYLKLLQPVKSSWAAITQWKAGIKVTRIPLALPGISGVDELPEICFGGSMTQPDTWKEDTRDRMFRLLPTCVSYVPVNTSRGSRAEEVAIRTRTINKIPDCSVPYIKSRSREWMVSEHVPINKTFAPYPMKQWNARFPKGKQKKNEYAYASIPSRDISEADNGVRSFVKDEIVPKRPDKFKPRNISGVSPRLNVVLGPEYLGFIKHLGAYWSINALEDESTKVVYASGYTSEQLGSVYDIAQERFGEVMYISSDHSKFDRSMNPALLGHEFDFYDMFNFSKKARQVYRMQMNVKGRTQSGWVYKADFGRRSGVPNTSGGNSIINAFVITSWLDQFGVDYILLILGDDAITFMAKGDEWVWEADVYYEGDYVNGFQHHCSLMGLQTDVDITSQPWEAEFCSKLFWPTPNGTVLGAKIGRCLCKLPWSTREVDDTDLKSKLIGNMIDNNHVPFVNDYVKHCMKLLSDVDVDNLEVDKYKIHASSSHQESSEAMMWVLERYGLNGGDREQFKRIISETNRLTTFQWDQLHDLVVIDGGDPLY